MSNDLRPANAPPMKKVWAWKDGIGDSATWCVAHLTNDTLFLLEYLITSDKDSLVNTLQLGPLPAGAFKDGKTIPLNTIEELKLGKGVATLEVHYGQKRMISFSGDDVPVHSELYDALRNQIAPHIAETEGTMSVESSIYAPMIGLFFSIFAGGLAVWRSTTAVSNPHNIGRRRGFMNAIDMTLAKLGVPTTVAIVVGLAACFASWAVYRFLHPHKATVLKIS